MKPSFTLMILNLSIIAGVWVTTSASPANESTHEWQSRLLNRTIPYVAVIPENGSGKMPVVVYLTGLPTPRLGSQSDETLIQGFLDQGMLVLKVDYQNDPKAVAPELLPEIDDWYGFLFEDNEFQNDRDWIYIIPAGYTIDRKVSICEVQGKTVGMDVIYPSGSPEPVPAVLQITSTKDYGKWINQRAYYIYGLLTAGYAGAIMDWNGGTRVSPRGNVFPEKHAARLLRARADDWNLSGKLGVTGHSKGSSRAAVSVFINETDCEADTGPNAAFSSRFQAALMSAGQHDKTSLAEDGFADQVGSRKREAFLASQEDPPKDEGTSVIDFVSSDDAPVFLCIGVDDKPFRVAQMKRLAEACQKVNVLHKFVLDPDLGHAYNSKPEVIGQIFQYFDAQLK